MSNVTKRTILAALLSALALPTASAAPAHVTLPDVVALRARYALPQSRFITLDGTPIHYTDEGQGPAIVLMHGSYASLLQWNVWARVLSRSYRVVRFDMPPAGLSGPSPDGNYALPAKLAILAALTKALKLERFVLVATSSAGLPAAAYAADHPGQVRGVILNNIAIFTPKPDAMPMSPGFRKALAADAKLNGYHSIEFWRQVMLDNFADQAKVTAPMAQEWTDLNNRAPAMHQPPAPHASFERTRDDLARITAPTLLLWSAEDAEMSVAAHGEPALAALKASDKTLAVIPACGHLMPLECPDAALKPTLAFLKRIRGAITAQ